VLLAAVWWLVVQVFLVDACCVHFQFGFGLFCCWVGWWFCLGAFFGVWVGLFFSSVLREFDRSGLLGWFWLSLVCCLRIA
jgi:hypothetical protein